MVDLGLIEHRELACLKKLSCSPMSFATKILFRIFSIDELHGHNVSGKTLNKQLKSKLPLDATRVGYIKYLVDKYYDERECREMLSGATAHKQDLWRSCHTAINKGILTSEALVAAAAGRPYDVAAAHSVTMPNAATVAATTAEGDLNATTATITTSNAKNGESSSVQERWNLDWYYLDWY